MTKSENTSLGIPQCIYGVDFSGAVDAGKKIWITSALINGNTLQLKDCFCAATISGSEKQRTRCLVALCNLIESSRSCAFGFDFPFGLPLALIHQKSWQDFVLSFPEKYISCEGFRRICYHTTGGSELKRVTDLKAKTPFSPYNLRLYRQTYFGIRDLLHPIVRDRIASVLPMQKARPDRVWILEVCPASLLKQENLYFSYKGKTERHYRFRMKILKTLVAHGQIAIESQSLQKAVLEEPNGDALDSVIAAVATFRALRPNTEMAISADHPYMLEGYVYV